ncbi:cyclic pyranopterin monophosphate synthase MoaC [Sphingomicrobium sp. XHP0235]|uniref:cyclic pyranopterin monophosphate synthase MoaC n=1 Tax=Sphingomicrobium aquimarinum TaxID=3133971 RepID=UPI0031FEF3A7
MSRLSHLDAEGRARMVDVGDKAATDRHAVASAWLRLSAEAMEAVADGQSKKGDIVRTAELAGIMGAKRTADLIPLCHPLPLDTVRIDITLHREDCAIEVRATTRTHGRTGVEMEAMTAASVAALTLYDMIKAVDRGATVESIRVEEKSGGKSGDWQR